jgi:hypothetical protein
MSSLVSLGSWNQHVCRGAEPGDLLLGLPQQLFLGVNVFNAGNGHFLQPQPQFHRLLNPPADELGVQVRLRLLAAEMEHLQLLQVVDAHERVAEADSVVEEGERLALGQCQQPQRQPGHLHGQRVLVHPVEAPLGHQAVGVHGPVAGLRRNQLLVQPTACHLPKGREAKRGTTKYTKYTKEDRRKREN